MDLKIIGKTRINDSILFREYVSNIGSIVNSDFVESDETMPFMNDEIVDTYYMIVGGEPSRILVKRQLSRNKRFVSISIPTFQSLLEHVVVSPIVKL